MNSEREPAYKGNSPLRTTNTVSPWICEALKSVTQLSSKALGLLPVTYDQPEVALNPVCSYSMPLKLTNTAAWPVAPSRPALTRVAGGTLAGDPSEYLTRAVFW